MKPIHLRFKTFEAARTFADREQVNNPSWLFHPPTWQMSTSGGEEWQLTITVKGFSEEAPDEAV